MTGQARAMEATVERVLDRVRESLLDIEKRYRASGRSVAELGIDEVARRMTSAVPAPSPVNDEIGPFCFPAPIRWCRFLASPGRP